MNRTLTIVGASVRAAAQSARQAGFVVHAGDLFADLDLRRDCHATAIADYPRGLGDLIAGSQSGPWMYTGALENAPDLIAQWSTVRPLLGNDADVLRQVRDPWLVSHALRDAGLPAAKVAPQGALPPCDGRWLRKPRRSASGMHIAHWDEDCEASVEGDDVFQEFIAGLPCSAVYIATDHRAVLLGVTRQLIGQSWCGASGFRYCGSVGPLPLPASTRAQFELVGHCLAKSFDLVGLFGVDVIVNDLGVLPIEVNPRYTASAELFDRSSGVSTVALHVDACLRGDLPAIIPPPRHLCGKAILFADRSATVGNLVHRWLSSTNETWPCLADIPAPGTTFSPGWPIVTVFARGDTEYQVLERLKREVLRVRDDVRVWLPSAQR